MSTLHAPDSGPRRITMRMHRDPLGVCWADSGDLPGWTAISDSFADVMDIVRKGLTPQFVDLEFLVDLRWQWCDTDRGILAVGTRGQVQLPAATTSTNTDGLVFYDPFPCPCEATR